MLSHTLGPSTTFASPAVSRISEVDGKKYCDTFVAVAGAPDVSAEDAGHVVWRLRTLFEGGMGSGSFDKTSAKVRRDESGMLPSSRNPSQVPYPILKIDVHPTQVVLTSKRGAIIALNDDLNISHELSCDDEEDRFLRSFSYPRTRCTFLPDDIPSLGEILVLFLVRRDTIRVRVLRVDKGDGVVQIASVELASNAVSCTQPKLISFFMFLQTVADITFSESGNISLLCMAVMSFRVRRN